METDWKWNSCILLFSQNVLIKKGVSIKWLNCALDISHNLNPMSWEASNTGYIVPPQQCSSSTKGSSSHRHTHMLCVCKSLSEIVFAWSSSQSDFRKRRVLVTTQCTMFPDLIKILHLAISGLLEPKIPWYSQNIVRLVNPISTWGANYAHHITTGLPGFWDLPTALPTIVPAFLRACLSTAKFFQVRHEKKVAN